MTAPRRWLRAAVFVGVGYGVVGLGFGVLGSILSRWAAFIVSGLFFTLHFAFEHFRFRNAARATAWHVSVAVALGALILAAAANIHDLGNPTGYRPRMVIALVAWPLLTAVPAFVVALVGAIALRRRPADL